MRRPVGSTEMPGGVVRISTDSIAERERFDFWRDVVNREYGNLEVSLTGAPGRFAGSLTHMNAGSVQLREVTAGPTPHLGALTPRAISRAEEHAFVVTVVVDGTGVLVQGDRAAVLGPGDLTLHDTSRPFTVQFERGFHLYHLQVPHALWPT